MTVTPALFAEALLGRLGLPVTDNNVAALVSFQAHEGGHMHNGAAFNPMNTTMPMPGGHSVTDVGVKAYSSWKEGLEATAKTLTNGLYKSILASLSKSASPDDTMKAIAASPWGCTICANAPAASFQSYRDVIFPEIAPDHFGLPFFPHVRASKFGVAAAALLVLGGLGLVAYAARR